MVKKIIVTKRDYFLITNFINNNPSRLSDYTFVRLSKELEEACVIAEDKKPEGVIGLYSEVELLETTLRKQVKVSFVLPGEADAKQHKISIFSPLGMALIGYQKGDVVEWELHGKMRKFIVRQVINH